MNPKDQPPVHDGSRQLQEVDLNEDYSNALEELVRRLKEF